MQLLNCVIYRRQARSFIVWEMLRCKNRDDVFYMDFHFVNMDGVQVRSGAWYFVVRSDCNNQADCGIIIVYTRHDPLHGAL